MKVGEKVYINMAIGQAGETPTSLAIKSDVGANGHSPSPESIEFSDRLILYRRGILQPPEPRVIELNAQVMPSLASSKPVRVRCQAKGALKTSLYQDGTLITQEFRPSDEYETTIANTTVFKVLADYGNGETAEQEARVVVGSIIDPPPLPPPPTETLSELDGTVNKVFTSLIDLCGDRKVQEIESIEIAVDKLLDYRKLGTAIPLLS
ncbi:hypothetical protein [Pleurocapsa sp. FMAR1]|uniref:hypothetical protein n=1 Tax=Pleurocapsa sp. FMAR1 TaxID=3040204 RepID=UPI0029C7EEBF|nr:hypothetical protein [Pleurocapsa sp. FMAR1]